MSLITKVCYSICYELGDLKCILCSQDTPFSHSPEDVILMGLCNDSGGINIMILAGLI